MDELFAISGATGEIHCVSSIKLFVGAKSLTPDCIGDAIIVSVPFELDTGNMSIIQAGRVETSWGDKTCRVPKPIGNERFGTPSGSSIGMASVFFEPNGTDGFVIEGNSCTWNFS